MIDYLLMFGLIVLLITLSLPTMIQLAAILGDKSPELRYEHACDVSRVPGGSSPVRRRRPSSRPRKNRGKAANGFETLYPNNAGV